MRKTWDLRFQTVNHGMAANAGKSFISVMKRNRPSIFYNYPQLMGFVLKN